MHRVSFVLVLLAAMTAITSCSDSRPGLPALVSGPDTACAVGAITVFPSTATLHVGDTVRFVADVNRCGHTGVSGAVAWRLSDTSIANLVAIDTITARVTARALGAGSTIATARADTSVKGAAAISIVR